MKYGNGWVPWYDLIQNFIVTTVLYEVLYQYNSTSALTVAVAPRNLQITPKQATYQAGDRIRCSAEGNPAPSYHWTNLITGGVIQGDVFEISEDMANRSYTFQCTATNEYNSISSALSFNVEGMRNYMSL